MVTSGDGGGSADVCIVDNFLLTKAIKGRTLTNLLLLLTMVVLILRPNQFSDMGVVQTSGSTSVVDGGTPARLSESSQFI